MNAIWMGVPIRVTHRRKFAKREAQPDGEEQQRHPSLGEQLDIFDLSI